MKLPAEFNVIFTSMERCGISWIIRILNKIHELMFDYKINISLEISRMLATDQRLSIPDGWYSVYYIEPEMLLKRDYDKVISIQRPLETIYKVLSMYYRPDLTYEECRKRLPDYFKNVKYYYEKLYGRINKITDPRFRNFKLDDFNNYTSATFYEIMDFLDYPKKLRPIIVPVNPPERNWQAYSTTLSSSEEIGQRLMNIHNKYRDKILEIDIQKKYRDEKKEEEEKPKNFNTKLRKPKLLRIPKITKQEGIIQGNRKFRLNASVDIPDALKIKKTYKIFTITPVGYSFKCHLGEYISDGFKELGHDVQVVSYRNLIQKKLYPAKTINISTILKTFLKGRMPDFIFINEVRPRLINDVELPIFYFHTGWYCPLGVKGKNIINYFRSSELPKAYERDKRINKVMYHGIVPQIFYPENKTIKGVCGIGFRRSFDKWRIMVGALLPFMDPMEWETKQFISLGYRYFNTPVKDLQYRELQRKIEALNPLIGYGEYVSRRVLEAMACKTLIFFRLDFTIDKDGKRDASIHRKMLESMGYYANEHYIEIKNNYEIEQIWNNMTEEMKKEMREKAYKVTLERHTHINRAEQIIKDYESGEWRNGEN